MRPARWRLWRWMLLGLFLGALAGFVRTQMGPGFDSGIGVTLNPLTFEDYILRGRAGGKDVVAVRDLTVHPPFDETGIDWVTGVAVLQYNAPQDPTKPGSPAKRWEELQPFRFSTTVPYAAPRGRGGEVPLAMGTTEQLRQYPSNRDYLQKLAETFPDRHISFTYAWWDAPKMRLALWTGIGFVVFGLVIPLFVRLLVPMPPEQKGANLRKVRPATPVPQVAGQISAQDQAQLADLEAQLEKNLAGAFPASPDDSLAPPAGAPPVRKLDAGPLAAPQTSPGPLDGPREYAGEFYPTVAHAPRQDDEPPKDG